MSEGGAELAGFDFDFLPDFAGDVGFLREAGIEFCARGEIVDDGGADHLFFFVGQREGAEHLPCFRHFVADFDVGGTRDLTTSGSFGIGSVIAEDEELHVLNLIEERKIGIHFGTIGRKVREDREHPCEL